MCMLSLMLKQSAPAVIGPEVLRILMKHLRIGSLAVCSLSKGETTLPSAGVSEADTQKGNEQWAHRGPTLIRFSPLD